MVIQEEEEEAVRWEDRCQQGQQPPLVVTLLLLASLVMEVLPMAWIGDRASGLPRAGPPESGFGSTVSIGLVEKSYRKDRATYCYSIALVLEFCILQPIFMPGKICGHSTYRLIQPNKVLLWDLGQLS